MHFTLWGIPLSALPSAALLVTTLLLAFYPGKKVFTARGTFLLYLLFLIFCGTTIFSVDVSSSIWFLSKFVTALCLMVVSYNAVSSEDDYYKMLKLFSWHYLHLQVKMALPICLMYWE